MPEERVKQYEAGIKRGGIVMAIRPRSDADARAIADDWRNYKAEHVYPEAGAL